MSYVDLDTIQRPSSALQIISAWGDGVNDNFTFLYGDTAYTNVISFTNSWVSVGSGNAPVGYRLVGTRVWLRGSVSSGTNGTAAFTLPSGYRPQFLVTVPVASDGAFGLVTIATSGTVTPNQGITLGYSLDSVSFDII